MEALGAVSTTLTYRSFAKLNLYLEVLGRREDGYHNIETIFQTVGLSDELRFTACADAVTLECDSPDLGAPEENLAWRAAMLLRERCSCERGVHIELDKRIPVAAGLAGGSGNAAATLVALNQLWELGLSEEELRAFGLELGSDVPYCIVGGTVAATGRGEALDPLAALHETAFVLLHPPIQVSTARVYNHPLLRKSDEKPLDDKTASFKVALGLLSKGAIADVVSNAMEMPVFSEHPELSVLKQRLLDAGCAASLMSGSGPTIFGVCRNVDHAAEVASAIPEVASSVVTSVPHGVESLG